MQNYFTLLGLEQRFALDEAALQRAYITAQQETHPDRLVGKPDAERAKAIQKSMDVNEAYEALKNPLKRAEHLLALQDIRVNSDGNDNVKASQALLMETMELREQLAEASDARSLQLLVEEIKQSAKTCKAELEQLLDAQDYDAAAQATIRLRYLGKSMEEAQMHLYQHQAQASAS